MHKPKQTNTEGNVGLNPDAVVAAAYTNSFFEELNRVSRRIVVDFAVRDELKNIAHMYLDLNRQEEDPDKRRARRSQSAKLAKQTQQFLDILHDTPRHDLIFSLYMAALRTKAPIPATKFDGLSEHAQRQSGEPYFRELERLLILLKTAAEEQSGVFQGRPGPKINLGLEYLVRHVADLFDTPFKRSFSIDHHKPVPTGEAVDFIRALVAPLDDIPDAEIATAIRAEQKRRIVFGLTT